MSQKLQTTEEMEWESVELDLPDADETVLLFHPDEDEPVEAGYWDGTSWHTTNGTVRAVSHWAPMPDGPEG